MTGATSLGFVRLGTPRTNRPGDELCLQAARDGPSGASMTDTGVRGSAAARSGHFLLESGHHGDLWLDLELLCLRPREIAGAVAALAEQLRPCDVDAVCGPLNEGAFVALLVAAKLDVAFTYAERFESPDRDRLFSVQYRIPAALRATVVDKR